MITVCLADNDYNHAGLTRYISSTSFVFIRRLHVNDQIPFKREMKRWRTELTHLDSWLSVTFYNGLLPICFMVAIYSDHSLFGPALKTPICRPLQPLHPLHSMEPTHPTLRKLL